MFTDTPVRNRLLAEKSAKERKQTTREPVKKQLFGKKTHKAAIQPVTENESSEEEMHLAESSEEEYHEDVEEAPIEGDFVVVKVSGKKRFLLYIARVDVVDGVDFEGVFLKRVPNKAADNQTCFVPNLNDEAMFSLQDIVGKLPQPKLHGGSARRSCNLLFPERYLTIYDIANH